MRFDLNETIEDGRGFFARDYRGNRFSGVEQPWLAASGCEGLRQCSIPLLDPGKDGPATYTVRLGLSPRLGDAKATSPCDICLQGKTVADGVTLSNGGPDRNRPVVKEFSGIHDLDDRLLVDRRGDESLQLELAGDHPPVVNFVEIVRE